MSELEKQFNEIFNIFIHDGFGPSEFIPVSLAQNKISYPFDMYEIDDVLKIEIPCLGIEKEDIKIKVKNGNTLEITNVDKKDENESKKKYLVKKLTRKKFRVEILIGDKFDIDKLSASISKGLLNITIPISETKKDKEIIIN